MRDAYYESIQSCTFFITNTGNDDINKTHKNSNYLDFVAIVNSADRQFSDFSGSCPSTLVAHANITD